VTELEEKNKQIMFLTSRLATKDQLISELRDAIKELMTTIGELMDKLKNGQ